MEKVEKPQKTIGIYLVLLYLALHIIFLIAVFVTSYKTFLNPINIALFFIGLFSAVGLWMMKKWGAALTAFLGSAGMAINAVNLQLVYTSPEYFTLLGSLTNWWYPILLAGTLIVNLATVVYIFKNIFENRFV